MNASNLFLVTYRRPNSDLVLQEYTSNVAITVAMLESQGYVIVEILDIGYEKN